MPGQGGSVVVSGHRTTYGAPFRKLDELEAGDEIELVMPYAIIRYTVTQVIIVAPDEVRGGGRPGARSRCRWWPAIPYTAPASASSRRADLSSFVLLEPGSDRP